MRAFTLCLAAICAGPATGATVTGTVTDGKGGVLQTATITIKNEATGNVRSVKVDGQGHFSLGGFAPGRYTIEVSAPGFGLNRRDRATHRRARPGHRLSRWPWATSRSRSPLRRTPFGSIAAALAPMDASLEARSARTYISPTFIQNFTSPVADYGEAVADGPGTFTLNGNGAGLGQSKTYFRGFPDGDLRHRLRRHSLLRHQLAYPPLLGLLPLSVSWRHRLRPQSRHCLHHRAHPLRRLHPSALQGTVARPECPRPVCLWIVQHLPLRWSV